MQRDAPGDGWVSDGQVVGIALTKMYIKNYVMVCLAQAGEMHNLGV